MHVKGTFIFLMRNLYENSPAQSLKQLTFLSRDMYPLCHEPFIALQCKQLSRLITDLTFHSKNPLI